MDACWKVAKLTIWDVDACWKMAKPAVIVVGRSWLVPLYEDKRF